MYILTFYEIRSIGLYERERSAHKADSLFLFAINFGFLPLACRFRENICFSHHDFFSFSQFHKELKHLKKNQTYHSHTCSMERHYFGSPIQTGILYFLLSPDLHMRGFCRLLTVVLVVCLAPEESYQNQIRCTPNRFLECESVGLKYMLFTNS